MLLKSCTFYNKPNPPYIIWAFGDKLLFGNGLVYPIYFFPTFVQLLLEHVQRCLVCDPAHYNCMKKSQNMLVLLKKLVLVQRNSMTICGAW
jgi:hypothetical protein